MRLLEAATDSRQGSLVRLSRLVRWLKKKAKKKSKQKGKKKTRKKLEKKLYYYT